MNLFIEVLSFLIFLKLFLFWLWLWQLKEYHIGRFISHFETQGFKKFFSSFWRIKYPKFTKKIIAIASVSIFLALWMIFNGLYFYIYFLIIIVPSIFQAMTFFWRKEYLAKATKKREEFKNLLVIGITGSYGKTSTKEFLYQILVEKYKMQDGKEKILKTREHQNSEMGIAGCILNDLNSSHEIFICEMGAYGRGGIKLLCDIAKPKIGILTGINEQHLSTFGSLENIIKAKYELIESLPADGIAFFNAKNAYCRTLYDKTKIKKNLYGQEAKFAGEENILGAMAIAKELGMSDEEIQRATDKIKNKFPGIEVKKGINGLTIIDATYSANPDGVMANLNYLAAFSGRKIIIMPCLIELGNASAEIHKKIGKKIAEVCDLGIITTKDRFTEIKEGAASAGALTSQVGEKIFFIEDPEEILKKINDFCRAGDTILLESRVSKEVIDRLAINM